MGNCFECMSLRKMQEDLIENLEEQLRLSEEVIANQAKIIQLQESLLSEQALNKVS